MREEGIDIASATPAPLTQDALAGADVVITLGCAHAVPAHPDKRHEEWPLTHNSGEGLAAARDIRDQIQVRVRGLLTDLLA